jgi:hypothetical protein
MARYIQDDGEWFEPKQRGFRQQCCHCGLVHEIDFRVNARGRVEVRFFQHPKATAAARRSRKKNVVIVGD